jgi:hypothetical protein
MDVTFLESEPFFPSPLSNSPLQGETNDEAPNWLRFDWARPNNTEIQVSTREPKIHEESLHAGLDMSARVETSPREVSTPPEPEAANDTPHSSVPEDPSPENIPEVNPTIPSNSNDMDTRLGYTLPFRHNRGN